MNQLTTHRYTITVPDNLAKLIEKVCVEEGRNRSELFREAFRCYLNNNARSFSSESSLRHEEAFPLFWSDRTFKSPEQDRLSVEREKDRLLEQWAHMVETDPEFEDIRAVSDCANAIAGEITP